MSLSPGQRLGPYEIVSVLGAGGMGEVYRAHDTRLDRDVAIKVLPEAFASDKDRVARFEREAKAIAALSHPNILAIHDTGRADGQMFVVTELLEGETLRDRIGGVARGGTGSALPVRKAIDIAVQIARGLSAAHDKAIVHRDLKPENVFLTHDGHVKILDFGLARQGAGNTGATQTTQAVTDPGTVMGTIGYMAPEQVRGQTVDARCDIFALGAVFYEMLTGRRAFERDTSAETMTAILREEPADLVSGPERLDPAVDRVVRHCLEKNPAERFQSARDFIFALGAATGSAASPVSTAPARPNRLRGIGYALMLLVGMAIGAAGLAMFQRPAPVAPAVTVRASFPLPPGARFNSDVPDTAISPDGRTIVYSAEDRGTRRLFRRSIDSFAVEEIRGTEQGYGPFFSPDGRSIGFVTPTKLKRVALDGSLPQDLCDVQAFRGAAWGPGDLIVLTPTVNGGMFRIDRPGHLVPLTTVDESKHERTHRSPVILPDGRLMLFVSGTDGMVSFAESSIMAVRLDQGQVKGEAKVIVAGGFSPQYAAETGRLFWNTGKEIVAQKFDPDRIALVGDRETILSGDVASRGASGTTNYAVSQNETLIYLPGGELQTSSDLVRIERRTGAATVIAKGEGTFTRVRLSADETRILLVNSAANDYVQVYDVTHRESTRLTFHRPVSASSWIDDQHILLSDGGALFSLSIQGREEKALIWGVLNGSPRSGADVSSDGEHLVFVEDADLFMLSKKTQGLEPFVQSDAEKRTPRFSPSGQWVAYVSVDHETHRPDVMVKPVSGTNRSYRVSRELGGAVPVWARTGSELFFENPAGDALFSVDMHDPTNPGDPKPLPFPVPQRFGTISAGIVNYDVNKTGDFIFIQNKPAPVATLINVIVGGLNGVAKR